MGISLQEYLANRQPCSVCDSTGNQHHCISELLSREDSCLLYNAIRQNQDSNTDNDTVLLQELRYITNPEIVLTYYLRSHTLVSRIASDPNKEEIYNVIYNRFVSSLLPMIRNKNTGAAIELIMGMVSELEKVYLIH